MRPVFSKAVNGAVPHSLVSRAPMPAHRTTKPAVRLTQFIPSGSHLCDRVNGGGWAQGRIVNIVGDKSTGKTLVAIEACANLAMLAPVTNIRYAECEHAFDEAYGQSMGFPAGVQIVDTIRTIEDFFDDIEKFLEAQKKNPLPCLYVLDSLDALSDDAEMERDRDKGSYGALKAKKLSEFFRTKTADISLANCTLIIVSQIRDKLNVTFGETKTRSGGKALDFYCSQIVWLIELDKIKRTVLGVDRVVGLHVRVRNRKNKVGMAYREADQTLLFGYGFDSEDSMIRWLVKSKGMDNQKEWLDAVARARQSQDRATLVAINEQLKQMVDERWDRIEAELAPPMEKYAR